MEPIVRLPDGQGVGVQQAVVLAAGQHDGAAQQVVVQQLVVQQLVGQQAGLDTGQQIGCAAALLVDEAVGIGQQVM